MRLLKAIQEEGLGKTEVLERFHSVLAVADASFEVRQAEIFCIMGLSGSGKSTLLRLINRLIDPIHGHVLINGQDISHLDAKTLRTLRSETIGMVFQDPALLPHRTVRDNVAFPLELRHVGQAERSEAAEKMLDHVGLSGWDDRMPSELSGGMQQRVGLARAPGSGSGHPAYGRTIQCPRSTHSTAASKPVPRTLFGNEENHRVHYPRP